MAIITLLFQYYNTTELLIRCFSSQIIFFTSITSITGLVQVTIQLTFMPFSIAAEGSKAGSSSFFIIILKKRFSVISHRHEHLCEKGKKHISKDMPLYFRFQGICVNIVFFLVTRYVRLFLLSTYLPLQQKGY